MKIPSDWKMKTFADVAEIITGNTPDRKEGGYYSDKGLPWVKIPDLASGEVSQTSECLTPEGAKHARILPENAVMVSCIGTIGKVGISNVPLATNQQINSLVFDTSKVLHKYGYYYCVSKEDYFKTVATKSVTMPMINKSSFSKIEIPVPPIWEQEHIALILDNVWKILQRKFEANARLNQYISALFNKMFGAPESASRRFTMKPLEDLILKMPQSGIFKNETSRGEGYPIVKIRNIKNGYIDSIVNLEKVVLREDELERYALNEGDIIIDRVNSIDSLGKCAFVGKLDMPIVFDSNIMRIGVNAKKYNPQFLAIWISTEHVKDYLRSKAKKSVGRSSLTQKDVLQIRVPMISIEKQNEFVKMLNDYIKIKERLDFTTDKIQKAFKLMLEQAFTGVLTDAWRKKQSTYREIKVADRGTESENSMLHIQDSSKVKYNSDTHCLEIDGVKYLSRKGNLVEPLEIPENILEVIHIRDIPKGVSVKKMKNVIDCTGEDYGRLEFVTIGRSEKGTCIVEFYKPYEKSENQEQQVSEDEKIILNEIEDFIYIKQTVSSLSFSDETVVLDAIRCAEVEMKKHCQNFYNRFKKIHHEAVRFITMLSLYQKALYEEFLLAPDDMAIHTAVKRINKRMRNNERKLFSIQDGIQTVTLLEGFGLLEKEEIFLTDLFDEKPSYKKETDENKKKTDDSLTIDLWRWTGSMEG